MNQFYQKFINFKCDRSIHHRNQPITHICVDKNCKSSIESYSALNGKRSVGKIQTTNSFLLCQECIQSNHHNHQVIPIEQFIREAKTESNANIYDINKQSPNYQLYEQKKNNVLSTLSKLTQRINNYAALIKAKELSESSNKTLSERLITENLQQQEFIMQRIFTLEGNNYTNQTEFEIMLKEVQDGTSKYKNVLKQYEQTKKEDEIQLKEIDLISVKLNDETSKIYSFFEREISLHVNQKLTEYIKANFKNQGQSDKSNEEQSKEMKNPITEQSAFQQISKLFSSGAKNAQTAQNLQDPEESQLELSINNNRMSTSQKITKQRLLDIQNLNPSKNNNSTPIASKSTINQAHNSAGFSNSKQSKFSSALTNATGFTSDQKKVNEMLNQRSSTSSAIKGYSILSAIKSTTPQQITNENEFGQTGSIKKETPLAFSQVFPQAQNTSKVVSPAEKRVFGQNVNNNIGNNIVFVTNNQCSAIREQPINTFSNQKQVDTASYIRTANHLSKVSSNSSKIRNIGGNLSPISKPNNMEDEDLQQTAQEIIQENNIEWLDSHELNLIDRGQFLKQGMRRQIDDEFEVGRHFEEEIGKFNHREQFNLENNKQFVDFDEGEDAVDAEEEEDDEEEDDDEEIEEEPDFQFQESLDQNKENNQFKSFIRPTQPNTNFNTFGSTIRVHQLKPLSGQEPCLQNKKKEKRLRKRQQKKIKKLFQQHDLIECQQQSYKLKPFDEDKKLIENETLNLQTLPIEAPKFKSFQYSSYDPLNKKIPNPIVNQLKKADQTQKQPQNQQLSASKPQNKDQNFQNLLNQMISNSQQPLPSSAAAASQVINVKQQPIMNGVLQPQIQTSMLQSKIISTASTQNVQNSSTHFDGDMSPTLSTYSNSEFTYKGKKKLKTNNMSNQDDQSYSSIQNVPSAATTINHQLSKSHIYSAQNGVTNNGIQGQSKMNNNYLLDNRSKLVSQQSSIQYFEDSNSLQQLQNHTSQHVQQVTTLQYKRDHQQPLTTFPPQRGNYQAPNNITHQQPTHQIIPRNVHNNNVNLQQSLNQFPNQQPQNPPFYGTNNNFRQQGRFNGRQQQQQQQQLQQQFASIQEYQQNTRMMSQSTIQSSQESYQAPAQSYQSQIAARHSSIIRPQPPMNQQHHYPIRQSSLDTSTPMEEAINIYGNKSSFENMNIKQQRNAIQSNINYSNPYTQLQNNSKIFDKNKGHFQEQNMISNECPKLNQQVSIDLESIQQQIEFTNSLKAQLEKKIQEEQHNSAKYSSCSSTKRLRFQIQDEEAQQNAGVEYYSKFGKNRNLNERLFENESVSSPNIQNNSYMDDMSPVLYSPGVQFSPDDSEGQV